MSQSKARARRQNPLWPPDPNKVPFGALIGLAHRAPRFQRRLLDSDDRRAESLLVLMSLPGAIDAIESLMDYSESALSWAQEAAASPQAELAERMLNDLTDAVDAMLQLHMAGVMDASRDLMELTVLFRDFVLEPQRVGAWQRVAEDERPRRFGFNALLRRHEEPLPFLGDNAENNAFEYLYHSRTLHPAMWKENPDQLTRAPERAAPELREIQIASQSWEICRHAAGALIMLLTWLDSIQDNRPDQELRIPPVDGWAVSEWLEARDRHMDATISDEDREKMDEMKRAYLPKKRQEAKGDVKRD